MSGYIGSKASVVTPGAERKKTFAITATTTSLTGLSYTPGFVHVFHNGIRLVDGTDYTATNGTSITLTNAALNGDEVVVVSYGTFTPADAYTKAEADSRYVNAAGDTMTGGLTIPSMTSTGAITASGGVYLGGTSAVNLLDDYEEGTWEPYWSDSSGNAIFASAPSSRFGYYTKIGDTVTANSYFLMPPSFTATGFYSAGGGLCIGGLPFVGKTDASLMNFYTGSAGYYQGFAGHAAGYSPHAYLRIGTNVLQLSYANGTAGTGFVQSVAYSSNSGIMTSVTYKTSS